MSLIAAATLLLVADGSVVIVSGPEQPCSFGYKELAKGDDRAAAEKMEACNAIAADDPAIQINHGVAMARVGEFETARSSFQAAARNADRYELETATGDWVDSRVLARRGMAMLDKGVFQGYEALAVR